MIRTVHAGTYRGWATVGGFKADVDLSATRQHINDGRGELLSAGLTWSGTVIILDQRVNHDFFALDRSVDVAVGDRTSQAVIVDVTPGNQSMQVRGLDHPPFDTDVER